MTKEQALNHKEAILPRQISFQEAKQYHEKYFETYEQIKDWQNEIYNVTYKVKTYNSYTILKRKRVIEKDFIYNTALNHPIQGSAADMLKLALVNYYDECHKNNLKYEILCNIHDEILVQCPSSVSIECATLLRDTMEDVGDKMLSKNCKLLVKVVADPFKCQSWNG